jgi:hypothetical protein
MVQSVIFGIVLYLTPSVLLLALLMCRKQFDFRPDELESDHPILDRGDLRSTFFDQARQSNR